jgi:hypothetical protein
MCPLRPQDSSATPFFRDGRRLTVLPSGVCVFEPQGPVQDDGDARFSFAREAEVHAPQSPPRFGDTAHAMSQENVDLTHRVIDTFNRRDLGAYLALTDAEVEFTPYEVWVQGASLTGVMLACEAGGKSRSRSFRISGRRYTKYETSETGRSCMAAFAGKARGAVRLLSGRCG